ncbi:hypothetical protein Scep_028243 [Stephania cephalantha]|uniref:Uncharacterized protein n=1 Tax=Stephania cephalantha TaxID=152367 RepID=A0AAP0HLW4_9MAGN
MRRRLCRRRCRRLEPPESPKRRRPTPHPKPSPNSSRISSRGDVWSDPATSDQPVDDEAVYLNVAVVLFSGGKLATSDTISVHELSICSSSIPGGQLILLGKASDGRVQRDFEGLANLHNQGSNIRILLTYRFVFEGIDEGSLDWALKRAFHFYTESAHLRLSSKGDVRSSPQTTPDQSVDDEAVYYKVAGECPKGCVYSLRSLWRKKRRYVDPDASTSQVADVFEFWKSNSSILSEDIPQLQRKILQIPDLQLSFEQIQHYTLVEIENILQKVGKTLKGGCSTTELYRKKLSSVFLYDHKKNSLGVDINECKEKIVVGVKDALARAHGEDMTAKGIGDRLYIADQDTCIGRNMLGFGQFLTLLVLEE